MIAEAGVRSQRFSLRAGLRAAFGRIGRAALDLAMPPLCPACRDLVGDPGALCASCWSKLGFITPPYCDRLGIPFAYDRGPGALSPEAIADPPAYRRARAALRYDEVARTLVHAFKYGDRLDLAPMLGGLMARAGRDILAGADALVPTPLHWRRLWARRFNQSATLAFAVSRCCGTPVETAALRRVRATAQQVGLSKSARAENVQGAFRVSAEARPLVRGKRLVVIDDVLTSGATAEGCARALLRAGAAQVDVLVLARVVDAVRLG